MHTGMVSVLQRAGADPTDTPELALQKQLLVTLSGQTSALAVLWGLCYIVFDEPLAGAIPLGYGVLSFASLAVFVRTRRFGTYRTTQLGLMLVLPFLLQLALGGFALGSAVIVWSFCAPLGALMMSTRRTATVLLVAFAGLVSLAVIAQPELRTSNHLPGLLVDAFLVLNVVGTAAVTYLAMLYFVWQKDRAYELLAREQTRSERLLLNVLPGPVAERLKRHEQTIADRFDEVSVLFADIVAFTPLSDRLGPEQLVELLNTVFTDFDALVDRHGLEKVRTIGDAYMVAAGVPVPRRDHAEALVALALEMGDHAGRVVVEGRSGLDLRIGVASGPAVAGVIGRSKFQYDLWGDTVNTASRMESQGVPGRIQLAESTYRLVRDTYRCESRGQIDIKGKGPVHTWLVEA